MGAELTGTGRNRNDGFEVSNIDKQTFADTPTAAGINSAPSFSLHGSCSKTRSMSA